MELDKRFGVLDYAVFGAMLLSSALVGVYFAFFAKVKQNTTSEYLMGGKTMGIFPISMSLIASYISGISLLGIPAEMYIYGTQLWVIIISEFFVSVTMAIVYLPVFYTLQITSSYEYLKIRFNSKVRLLGCCIFLMKQMLYIPIVIYVPALAFSQVTGVNLHLVTPITCIICIFYTTVGGLKAVVWTDTIQTIVMFFGVVIVMILGTIKVGGVWTVLQRSMDTGRIEIFNFDTNPTLRHTFWTVLVGNYFQWLASCSVNQAMVQRCLAMPTLKKANWTIMILAVGIICIVSMCCYTGLVIFARFYDCDPVITRGISKPDQLLPFFVMDIASWVPGLPGLFISSVFSAALSSMSTGLNSMTGVILEDLIRPMCKEPITEQKASTIMKIIVVIIGSICVAMVFIVEKMGTLIQAANSMAAITGGPLLGIFTLGMVFPWANATGTLVGGFCGLAFVAWMSLGTQMEIAKGNIRFPHKPISIDGCDEAIRNMTFIASPINEEPFFLYRLSYMYYTIVGTAIVIVIGLLVSYWSGANDPKRMSKDLFTPVIHKYLPVPKTKEEDKTSKQNTNEINHELKPIRRD